MAMQSRATQAVLRRALQSRGVASAAKSYDAVIVGAGALGSSCALELRKMGLSTLNVDSHPSAGYGSTSCSAAILRHFYSLEDTARLAWEGYHCYENWREHLGAPDSEELCHLWKVGCAVVDSPGNTECQTFIERCKATMGACKIPVEYWDEAEVKRRLPYLSTESYFPPKRVDDEEFGEDTGNRLRGFLFCGEAGYINDPQLAARNLAEAAGRQGADFRWKSKVVEILKDATGERVAGVRLGDGEVVNAKVVINAAGPHSNIVHDLGFAGASVEDDSKMRTKPFRVEMAFLNEPPGSNIDESMPVIADLDAGIYLRPQRGGTILAGSIEPECDPHVYYDNADDLDDGISEEWTNYAYRAALRLPELQVPNSAAGLVSLYDCTPDWVPIYDKTALGGFYAVCGTSGNQFKTAPVVGRICAELVQACENGRDHDKEPLRLEMQRTEGSVDLSIFSRLRQSKSTTNTVMG